MEENIMYVIDDEGNETAMEILFTFENDELSKKYVLFFDPSNDEDIFAASYDEEGNLFDVETEEEWTMIEEVFGAFYNEEE